MLEVSSVVLFLPSEKVKDLVENPIYWFWRKLASSLSEKSTVYPSLVFNKAYLWYLMEVLTFPVMDFRCDKKVVVVDSIVKPDVRLSDNMSVVNTKEADQADEEVC